MSAAAELLSTHRRGVSDVEVYAKLIAMTVTGAEEAIGAGLTGGLVNLVAKRMDEICSPPVEEGPKRLLEWINKETVMRLDTYRVKGRLVREEDGGKAAYLVAYECPIRQILYLEDLPGGKSLCMIMCRMLGRLFSKALGGPVRVEPSRIGPNACLLRLALSGRAASRAEEMDAQTEPPSMEEYERRLLESFSIMLRAIGWALYTTLGGNPVMSYRAGKSYGRLAGSSVLAEGYEARSLGEAVELLNTHLGGYVRVELEDERRLRVVESRFDEVIEREGIEHSDFIERTVQGFIAGVLEALLGERIDLKHTAEKNVYEVVLHGQA